MAHKCVEYRYYSIDTALDQQTRWINAGSGLSRTQTIHNLSVLIPTIGQGLPATSNRHIQLVSSSKFQVEFSGYYDDEHIRNPLPLREIESTVTSLLIHRDRFLH